MRDLSVVIPARNEQYLAITVEDVLIKKRADTEVIVILDGAWANPPVIDHPDVTVIYHSQSIGQRAATNEGCRLSKAKYIMKLDAHCILDEGFDVKLMADCEYNWTVIPRMYNLHAFDWKCGKCGYSWYQGPTPKKCNKCDNTKEFERIMVWKPRLHKRSDFMRFDSDLHFQYWGALRERPESKRDIADTMSFIGACWFMHRGRYWDLEGLDEKHGSWGQVGTEVSCKTWLSGGRLVVNKKTWFSHLFRTQGGDFGFPYPQSGNQVARARKYSQDMWLNNKWPKQKYPLSWLIRKFFPVPGWEKIPEEPESYFRQIEVECINCGKKYYVKPSRQDKTKCCSWECLNKYKSKLYSGRKMSEEWKNKIGEANTGENHGLWKGEDVSYKTLHQWVQRHKGTAKKCEECNSTENVEWANKSHQYKRDLYDWIELCKKCHWKYDHLTYSIVYYTDNALNMKIAHRCRQQILKAGLPIVSVSLKPLNFGKNIVLKMKRSYEAYFKQILTALENSTADIIFFCEHDWLYSPDHFRFTPPKKDVYYYNDNWWRLRLSDGHAVTYNTHVVPTICAYRELLLNHYRKAVEVLSKNNWDKNMVYAIGFEPGTHNRKERIEDNKAESWRSGYPNLDLRHENNLTRSKWKQSDFRNPRSCQGWKENDTEIIPWGKNQDIINMLRPTK